MLNSVGADSIPDRTTAGDFCSRFTADDPDSLTSAIHAARFNVWRQQPDEFFNKAAIDVDGVIVGSTGQCKEGMDISFKKIWGYHPLLVSFANTKEVLAIVNRSGNVHSAQDAAGHLDKSIDICTKAGFRRIRMRGDCRFNQKDVGLETDRNKSRKPGRLRQSAPKQKSNDRSNNQCRTSNSIQTSRYTANDALRADIIS